MKKEKLDCGIKINDKYLFFWKGPFSQWHKRPMTAADGVCYNCCEQYMMYNKALLFNDHDTANKILYIKDPREQQKLGREVKGFDQSLWDAAKEAIVENGNYLKFSQNYDLRKLLLKTGALLIAEASPFDSIWGIGMADDNPEIIDETKWGQNLLGKVLMKVRKRLIEHPVGCKWKDAKDDFFLTLADDLLFAYKCNITLSKKEEEELALKIAKDMNIANFSLHCLNC